jgi:hypothetical protein
MKKFGNLGKNEISKSEMRQVNGGKSRWCTMVTSCGSTQCWDGTYIIDPCGMSRPCSCDIG